MNQINKYYENLMTSTELENLHKKFYFDYMGEGYEKMDFLKNNVFTNYTNFEPVRSLYGNDFIFVQYTLLNDGVKSVAMDLILINGQEKFDHYHTITKFENDKQINGNTKIIGIIPGNSSMNTLKDFLSGVRTDFAHDYREHSLETEEINYFEVVDVKAQNNFVVTISDVKMKNELGTLVDLYRIEGNKIKEHWDCFTKDKFQPKEI